MASSGPQPKAEDVQNICDITGIGRAQAVILLKVRLWMYNSEGYS